IRTLKPEDRSQTLPEKKQETIILKKLAQRSLDVLDERYGDLVNRNEHLKTLQARFKNELKHFSTHFEQPYSDQENPMMAHQLAALEIVNEQRKLLHQMNHR